jgi:minimal PKS chain-length factor (CLF/KS beta)
MTTNIVITGIGIIAPNGGNAGEYHAAVNAGKSGLRPITRFDIEGYQCRVAGQIEDFGGLHSIPLRLTSQTDRFSQLGMAAAELALADGGQDVADVPPARFGVVTAASSGGNEFGQREIQKLWSSGPRSVGPYQSIAWFYAATTGQLSIRHGLKGHCGVVASEGAGGLDALGHCRRLLRRGAADVLITGGAEAPVSPYALACQLTSGQLSPSTRPDQCYLPYSRQADGYVPGEGSGMMLVESAETAKARKAPQVYAEVAGYCATHEGGHVTDPDGGTLARAITGALDDAGITAADVDVVFADGAAVPRLDAAEVSALHRVFGPEIGCPVTVPKTMTGRMHAAGGAMDVATAALGIFHGQIPPTVLPGDYESAYGLPLVRTAVAMNVRHALVVARGHGGFNAAVVLRRI